jgi:hypothetical protein
MRVRFPCLVLASVRDEQRLTGLQDGLAIRSCVERARLARISFGRAGDENFDVGGSTRMMEAEGTRMISARRFTNSCHFRMISEGTSVECATLELRSCGSEAALSPWILSFMEQFLGLKR